LKITKREISENWLGQEYKLLEELGSGANGTVWSAVDRAGTKQAIKILHRVDESDREQISREILIAAKIEHSGLVRYLSQELEQADDRFFIRMELAEGSSLKELISWDGKNSCTPQPLPKILDFLENAIPPLEFLHQKNIIHRDLHAGNVIVTPDNALRLVDYGSARLRKESEGNTSFSVPGTLNHAAPEKWDDPSQVGPPSDYFSLGVMAYLMSTGVLPFWESSLGRLHTKILRGEYPHPKTFRTDLPDSIANMIMALLHKDVAERMQNPELILTIIQLLRQGPGFQKAVAQIVGGSSSNEAKKEKAVASAQDVLNTNLASDAIRQPPLPSPVGRLKSALGSRPYIRLVKLVQELRHTINNYPPGEVSKYCEAAVRLIKKPDTEDRVVGPIVEALTKAQYYDSAAQVADAWIMRAKSDQAPHEEMMRAFQSYFHSDSQLMPHVVGVFENTVDLTSKIGKKTAIDALATIGALVHNSQDPLEPETEEQLVRIVALGAKHEHLHGPARNLLYNVTGSNELPILPKEIKPFRIEVKEGNDFDRLLTGNAGHFLHKTGKGGTSYLTPRQPTFSANLDINFLAPQSVSDYRVLVASLEIPEAAADPENERERFGLYIQFRRKGKQLWLLFDPSAKTLKSNEDRSDLEEWIYPLPKKYADGNWREVSFDFRKALDNIYGHQSEWPDKIRGIRLRGNYSFHWLELRP